MPRGRRHASYEAEGPARKPCMRLAEISNSKTTTTIAPPAELAQQAKQHELLRTRELLAAATRALGEKEAEAERAERARRQEHQERSRLESGPGPVRGVSTGGVRAPREGRRCQGAALSNHRDGGRSRARRAQPGAGRNALREHAAGAAAGPGRGRLRPRVAGRCLQGGLADCAAREGARAARPRARRLCRRPRGHKQKWWQSHVECKILKRQIECDKELTTSAQRHERGVAMLHQQTLRREVTAEKNKASQATAALAQSQARLAGAQQEIADLKLQINAVQEGGAVDAPATPLLSMH